MALLTDFQAWAGQGFPGFGQTHHWIGLGLITCIVWLVSVHLYQNIKDAKYNYPDPVPGIPFFGNSFQMPSEGQGPYMTKLASKSGDMLTMRFGGTPWIFLNSRRAVTALLDKKAAIYSSRQNLPMAADIISAGKRLLLMPYGPDWRKQRKAMHQILNNTKSNIFQPFQDVESRALLYHYMKKPDRWWEANARFANSIIMSVTYGKRSDLGDPDLTQLLNNAERFVPYLMPGRALVDIFPWLLKLPIPSSWQPWRWWGDALHQSTKRAYKKLLDDLLERRRLGTQKPCFMTEFLDNNSNGEFTTEECYFMAGTLIEAGSDTTRIILMEILAAAVLYPDWVERTQQQLDSVCGSKAERLPVFDDMPQLPLIKGIIKEGLRWKPAIAETGIPHALIKDDTFDGYKIAAGTVVTYSHWAISHLDYDDPDRFYPERFLDEDLDVPTKGHLGFGAGKLYSFPVCVGNTVAWNNMFIAVSRLLYCFDVSGVPGETIDTSVRFDSEFGKAPFEVTIKPRSEAHRQLIERECANAATMES
ncbi:cytochrome P450 [Fusarium oxysporum]|nr:cytochrome P450 [Fusarium oxysporum]